MERALALAKRAGEKGEVPVGAVIVKNGEIIAEAHNETEKEKNPLCHCEIIAIKKAVDFLGAKRLGGCTIYVTLEPCPMCMGALLHAKVDSVVFGAYDERAGAAGTRTDLTEIEYFKKPKILGGYMEEESKALLRSFFESKR